MGIEPSGAGDNFDVRMLPQPLESTDNLAVASLEIKNHILDVKHAGRATSSPVNHHGPALRWKAEFAGTCRKIYVNGRAVPAMQASLPGGVPACSIVVTIPIGGSATVTMM